MLVPSATPARPSARVRDLNNNRSELQGYELIHPIGRRVRALIAGPLECAWSRRWPWSVSQSTRPKLAALAVAASGEAGVFLDRPAAASAARA